MKIFNKYKAHVLVVVLLSASILTYTYRDGAETLVSVVNDFLDPNAALMERTRKLHNKLINHNTNNSPKSVGPLPRNYKAMVEDALLARLVDPDSAKIEVGAPSPTVVICVVARGDVYYAWRVPVVYNAKNRFGGYAGSKTGYAWIAGEYVQRFSDNDGACP